MPDASRHPSRHPRRQPKCQPTRQAHRPPRRRSNGHPRGEYRLPPSRRPFLVFLLIAFLTAFTGGINELCTRVAPYEVHVTSPPRLTRHVETDALVTAVLASYSAGRFTEAGVATTRAFRDAVTILYLLEELHVVDGATIMAGVTGVQAAGGGVPFVLPGTGGGTGDGMGGEAGSGAGNGTSYAGYYVARGATTLAAWAAETGGGAHGAGTGGFGEVPGASGEGPLPLNASAYGQFVNACYDPGTGLFRPDPASPPSPYANWMILSAARAWHLGLPGFETGPATPFGPGNDTTGATLPGNLAAMVVGTGSGTGNATGDALPLADAQAVFSCVASVVLAGFDPARVLDVGVLVTVAQDAFLPAADPATRLWGLLVLDLLGSDPAAHAGTVLESARAALASELGGSAHLHNLLVHLLTIAVVLDETGATEVIL